MQYDGSVRFKIDTEIKPVTSQMQTVINAIKKSETEASRLQKRMEEFAKKYPHMAENARSVRTAEDNLYNTSYETYLRGEISTYSDKMLELYGRYVVEYASGGHNLAYEIMSNSARMYGYRDVDAAERSMKIL